MPSREKNHHITQWEISDEDILCLEWNENASLSLATVIAYVLESGNNGEASGVNSVARCCERFGQRFEIYGRSCAWD